MQQDVANRDTILLAVDSSKGATAAIPEVNDRA
jgi:hypothetical protein